MSSEVVLDESIENGEWPVEFSTAWILVTPDPISGDTLACLNFDDRNIEGTVIESAEREINLPLPQAYVSWKNNGECREIFVHPEYRRRGIGTKLCAWARSYTNKNKNITFHAPNSMTVEAKLMYNYISNYYGEPYFEPEDFPKTLPYSYWGGYFV